MENNGMAPQREGRATRPSVTMQLQQAIEASELTRYEICKLTGIEQSALSRFMAGERGLTTTSLDRLGELLDLEIVMHRPVMARRNRKLKGK